MERASTADIDDVCNALLKLSVCFSILSASIKPKRKSKVFIIAATPLILAFTSDSRTIASASSHVASNVS